MFRNVIVGVDGRSGGRDAIALARRLLDPRGRLTLVNVHLETTAVIVHEFDSSARAETQRLLEREGEAAGGELALASVGGTSVAVGLHRYAEEQAADLLVVGACRRGVFGRVLSGDDTRASLRCAPCAVAIAPREYRDAPAPIKVIGVGYDAAAESQAALSQARELARAGGAEIHALILVAAVRFDGNELSPLNSVLVTDPRLNAMRRQLEDFSRVTARPAFGSPAEELETFGEEVDLLLIGSPSEGPEGRLVADRLSRRLARSPRCPLLAIPVPSGLPEFATDGRRQQERCPGPDLHRTLWPGNRPDPRRESEVHRDYLSDLHLPVRRGDP